MTKLSDTLALLLSTAAQRDTLSILPLPATLRASDAGKAIVALMTRGFVEQRETNDAAAVLRTDGDLRYGAFAPAAGLAAIGIEPDPGKLTAPPAPAPALAPAPTPPCTSKTDNVLTLLRRPNGATLAELIAATGWLPHTTRAALTGLRKKGHAITRCKRDDTTCYALPA